MLNVSLGSSMPASFLKACIRAGRGRLHQPRLNSQKDQKYNDMVAILLKYFKLP